MARSSAAIAALLAPVAGFLTPSLGKGGLAVRDSVLGQHLAAAGQRTCQHMPTRTPLRVGMCGEGATAEKYSETKTELVRKYRGYLKGTIDTDGEVLPEWRIDNRQVKLEAQGITAETAPKRAGEAIARTRQKYMDSFLADGMSPEQAEIRVEQFLSNPEMSVNIIWEAERKRFVEEEKGLDSRAKNLVTLGNLLLLPLVLLFLNSLPWQQSIEAAKFYISNNCQANGGIKCNGEGAQGQRAPDIIKALTPPANGGKIVREKRAPPPSVAQSLDAAPDADAPEEEDE